MATWKPDPSFYPSPRLAMKAPPEHLAYVASFIGGVASFGVITPGAGRALDDCEEMQMTRPPGRGWLAIAGVEPVHR